MPTKCLLKIKHLLHVGASNKIYLSSPVTFVPMTKCNGISSGRSFRLLNSVSLRCCSNRIFSRLSCSARLSSSKNDGEHLHIKHLCTHFNFINTSVIYATKITSTDLYPLYNCKDGMIINFYFPLNHDSCIRSHQLY